MKLSIGIALCCRVQTLVTWLCSPQLRIFTCPRSSVDAMPSACTKAKSLAIFELDPELLPSSCSCSTKSLVTMFLCGVHGVGNLAHFSGCMVLWCVARQYFRDCLPVVDSHFVPLGGHNYASVAVMYICFQCFTLCLVVIVLCELFFLRLLSKGNTFAQPWNWCNLCWLLVLAARASIPRGSFLSGALIMNQCEQSA